MEEIKIDGNNKTIDEIHYELTYCKENGQHATCRKSGHLFDSDDGLTLDDRYKILTGLTKDEYTKETARELYRSKLEAMKIEANKPVWIEKGKKLVYQERFPSWKECVDFYSHNKYGGNPIEMALEIMEALNVGERLDVVYKMINSDNEKLNNLVENIVFRYSKRGPEFKEYMLGDDITANDMAEIDKIKKMNTEFKKEERERERFGY